MHAYIHTYRFGAVGLRMRTWGPKPRTSLTPLNGIPPYITMYMYLYTFIRRNLYHHKPQNQHALHIGSKQPQSLPKHCPKGPNTNTNFKHMRHLDNNIHKCT